MCEGKEGYEMTNADKIRNMTNEELEEFIFELNEHCLAGIGLCDCSGDKYCSDICQGKTKEWLDREEIGGLIE